MPRSKVVVLEHNISEMKAANAAELEALNDLKGYLLSEKFSNNPGIGVNPLDVLARLEYIKQAGLDASEAKHNKNIQIWAEGEIRAGKVKSCGLHYGQESERFRLDKNGKYYARIWSIEVYGNAWYFIATLELADAPNWKHIAAYTNLCPSPQIALDAAKKQALEFGPYPLINKQNNA